MTVVEQLQAAAEHLAAALSLLDQSGASITAAQVDGALSCLRAEIPSLQLSAADFSALDRMIDEVYAYFPASSPMLTN